MLINKLDEHMSKQTKKQMGIKRAAYINIAAKYSSALLQLAYSVILARILTPDDFGIVAIAQVFVVFFNIFSDMGLGAAIIQRQDLSKQDVSRLFGFTILLAVALALLFALFGIPISAIYERAELKNVCGLLSFSVFFATLNTVPNSLLMKQKRFLLVGIRQITSVLAASVIGVTLARVGIGYYAIVAYSIANSFIIFVWNYAPIRVIPVFKGILLSVRKVFSYSAYLFGFNVINYFSRNLDNLLVGVLFWYCGAWKLQQSIPTYAATANLSNWGGNTRTASYSCREAKRYRLLVRNLS